MSVSADRRKFGKDNPEECKTKLEQWLFAKATNLPVDKIKEMLR